jgi:hypothetical protein
MHNPLHVPVGSFSHLSHTLLLRPRSSDILTLQRQDGLWDFSLLSMDVQSFDLQQALVNPTETAYFSLVTIFATQTLVLDPRESIGSLSIMYSPYQALVHQPKTTTPTACNCNTSIMLDRPHNYSHNVPVGDHNTVSLEFSENPQDFSSTLVIETGSTVQQGIPSGTIIENSILCKMPTPSRPSDPHIPLVSNGTIAPHKGNTTLSQLTLMLANSFNANVGLIVPVGSFEGQGGPDNSSSGSTIHSQYSTPSVSGQFAPPDLPLSGNTNLLQQEDPQSSSLAHHYFPHHQFERSNPSATYMAFTSHNLSNEQLGAEYSKWSLLPSDF